MIRPNKKEKMQMVRLAAACEKLHETAGNPEAPTEQRLEASRALAETFLKHFELFSTALRSAGR